MTTTVLNTHPALNRSPMTAGGTSLLARLWSSLEAAGQRRAQAELRRLSITYVSSDPAMSRRLRDIADATATR